MMRKMLSAVLCVMMLVCCLATVASASTGASITLSADKTNVVPGDTVTFTVTLNGSGNVTNGVWNYEFQVTLPAGLTVTSTAVGGGVSGAGFTAPVLENSLWGGSMGCFGSGYTGGSLVLGTFTCTVDEGVAGDLKASISGGITDSDGKYITVSGNNVTLVGPHICNPVYQQAVAPSCDKSGIKEHYKCSCGKLYADATGTTPLDSVVVPATGHTAGEWVTVEPTCTKEGKKVKYCTVCKAEVESEVIPATGHTAGEWVTVEPTCTVDGSKTCSCTVCGEEIESVVIEAPGHQNGNDSVVIKAPTCEATGISKGKCGVCGEELGEFETKALGHQFEDEWTVETPATCEADGKETRKCLREGCDAVEEQPIEKLGHEYGEWTVQTPATCETEGKEIRVCQREGCEAFEERPIAALGHEMEYPYNEETDKHDAICVRDGCEATFDPVDHSFNQFIGESEGKHKYGCDYGCEKTILKDKPANHENLDDVPKTGDITGQVVAFAACGLAAMMAVAYVYKRKTV